MPLRRATTNTDSACSASERNRRLSAPSTVLIEAITNASITVGYTSLSAFNAAFQELTGRTPTDYRASFRP